MKQLLARGEEVKYSVQRADQARIQEALTADGVETYVSPDSIYLIG